MSRMPDFIVIGAMKCATSTLHEQLAAQPGVFVSTPKEPNFFSDDEVYARGLDWYASLFEGAPTGDLCGESSTHYTKLPTHPRTVERMAEALESVRLVYVMRHPIDRLVSHYVHAWTKRDVSCPIDRAIDRHPELVDYGRYAMQLRPYVERFGRDSILPVFLGRLRAAPDDELARVGRFIGMPVTPTWDHALQQQNVSSARMRESRARDAVLGLPGLTTLRRALVPRGVRERVKRAWVMRRRPELSGAARRRLEGIFDEDLGELGAMLGVRLDCATFDEVTGSAPLLWKEAPATAA